MRRLVSLLSMLAVAVTFGAACSDPVSPEARCSEECTVSADGTPIGSNNARIYFDGTPIGSNN